MVYAGTAATYGRGKALVVATGMQTEFGKIAQLLQTVETGKTPLQQNLDKVGTVLARAAFVVVAMIVALGLLRGQPFVEMLHLWHCAGGGGGARSPAGGGDHFAGDWRAKDGQAQRADPPPARRGNAGKHLGDLLG